MIDYNVVSLFSSPIIQLMIDEDTDELKQHTDYTVSYNQDREMDNIPVGGKRVLEEFPRIKKLILDKFNFAAEEILRYKKRQYSITSSWLTSTGKGQFSQTHNHRNSFYSGVYYYDEYPEGSGGISFSNPNIELGDFFFANQDLEESTMVNSMAWNFFPRKNELILFPSYLRHSILKHEADNVRHSLAFNIVPLGNWGEADSSYNMSWIVPDYISGLTQNE